MSENLFETFRGKSRGLARVLMERIVAWCDEEGIESVVLHASDDGRPLYQQLGFIATNEMRLAGKTLATR